MQAGLFVCQSSLGRGWDQRGAVGVDPAVFAAAMWVRRGPRHCEPCAREIGHCEWYKRYQGADERERGVVRVQHVSVERWDAHGLDVPTRERDERAGCARIRVGPGT